MCDCELDRNLIFNWLLDRLDGEYTYDEIEGIVDESLTAYEIEQLTIRVRDNVNGCQRCDEIWKEATDDVLECIVDDWFRQGEFRL